jgi:hypothetical protein
MDAIKKCLTRHLRSVNRDARYASQIVNPGIVREIDDYRMSATDAALGE